MKKFIALMLIAVLALSLLCGCSNRRYVEILPDTFEDDIHYYDSLGYCGVTLSFKYEVKKKTVYKIKFEFTGYSYDGQVLWTDSETISSRQNPDESPYSFSKYIAEKSIDTYNVEVTSVQVEASEIDFSWIAMIISKISAVIIAVTIYYALSELKNRNKKENIKSE